MVFRENNPLSSLLLPIGIEYANDTFMREVFPSLNRSVEVVMMPRERMDAKNMISRKIVEKNTNVTFKRDLRMISIELPVPLEIGTEILEGEDATKGKLSNLWKGKYLPIASGIVTLELNISFSQEEVNDTLSIDFSSNLRDF